MLTRRSFFTTLAAAATAAQIKFVAPPSPPLAAPKLTSKVFIAARDAEIRELLLRMKHDLNKRFYADDRRSLSGVGDVDWDDYEDE